jgi:peptidoglycan-N-acetylglucosamine deacetylase
MPAAAKELYLTFDDGPVSGPTEFVLATLARANVAATFFCIGDNIRKHPDVFEKIVRAGHSVGNHTFNHLSGWSTGTERYLSNVKLCEDQINLQVISDQYSVISSSVPITDHRSPTTTKLFRPPYGRITRNQIKALSQFKIIMWDTLTNDYAQSLSNDGCLKGSIAAARPGSIVVFHDSHKAEKNMTYVLPRFIDHFMNLGYAFKSLR